MTNRRSALVVAGALLVLTVLLGLGTIGPSVPGQRWLSRNSEAWVMAALFLIDVELVGGTLRRVRTKCWMALLFVGTVGTVAFEQTLPGAIATHRESFLAVLVLALYIRLTEPWAHRRALRLIAAATVVIVMVGLQMWTEAADGQVASAVRTAVAEYAEAVVFVPLAVVTSDVIHGRGRGAMPVVVRRAWILGLALVPLVLSLLRPDGPAIGHSAVWANATEALLAAVILSLWFEVTARP